MLSIQSNVIVLVFRLIPRLFGNFDIQAVITWNDYLWEWEIIVFTLIQAVQLKFIAMWHDRTDLKYVYASSVDFGLRSFMKESISRYKLPNSPSKIDSLMVSVSPKSYIASVCLFM